MTGCHLAYVQTEIRSVVMQFEIQIHSVCNYMLSCGDVHTSRPTCVNSPVQPSTGGSTGQAPACQFIDVSTPCVIVNLVASTVVVSLVDWISDTRSQGCTDLQSLVKCLVTGVMC